MLPVASVDKYEFGDKVNKIKIQNVVATAALGTKIDLIAIMKVFRNVEYRPKKFPGLVFRLKRPRRPPSSSAQARWCARVPRARRWPTAP